MIRTESRTDGLSTLIWHVCLCIFNDVRLRYGAAPSGAVAFPHRGFVSLTSTLSAVTDPRPYRLRSIRLRRGRSTHAKIGAGTRRLWRLTYVWETYQRPPRRPRSGHGSAASGNHSEEDGVATFLHRTSIISTRVRSRPLSPR